jgi:hypothetical protein
VALLELVQAINASADLIEVTVEEAVDHSFTPAFAAKIRRQYPWIDDGAADALCWASRYRRDFE